MGEAKEPTIMKRDPVGRVSYLRDVLTRLPTMTNRQIKDVVPAAWGKAQEPAAQRRAA